MTSGPTFDLGSVRAEIDSLVVADAARGAGVGTALVATCREELRRRDIHYWSIGVVEENRDAIQLYERLGFRPWTRTMLGPSSKSYRSATASRRGPSGSNGAPPRPKSRTSRNPAPRNRSSSCGAGTCSSANSSRRTRPPRTMNRSVRE
jgi:hypothetical protein